MGIIESDPVSSLMLLFHSKVIFVKLLLRRNEMFDFITWFLTLKAPIKTAADDKFFNVFLNFRKKKGMIIHENLQPADDSHEISFLIFFFFFFEKAGKFEIVVCCKL